MKTQLSPGHHPSFAFELRGPAHVLEGTECAWKLWLDLSPGMRVLDLGCGYGARSVSLARHGVRIVAVETDRIQASATRHRLLTEGPSEADDHAVLVVSRLDRLPLKDGCADIVLLPVDPFFADTTGTTAGFVESIRLTPAVCAEANRLLRPEGQVLVNGANCWAFDRLAQGARPFLNRAHSREDGRPAPTASARGAGVSLFGYRRLLRHAGVAPAHCLSLWRDRRGSLDSIRDSGSPTRTHKQNSLRKRIRTARYLVPEFTVIGQRRDGRRISLINRILGALAEAISQRTGAYVSPKVQRLYLSRKDKLVLEVTAGEIPVIVRVALAPGSHSSEQRACTLLRHLHHVHPDDQWFPRVLTEGDIGGAFFMAEERLPGRALKDTHALHGSECVEIASQMLAHMNPQLSERVPARLEGKLFDRLVSQPLETVSSVIHQPRAHDQLRGFLHDQLYGVTIGVGITHGDFSVSNVLVDTDSSARLIDWEDGGVDGLPILDVLTFVHSRRRALSSAATGRRKPPSSLFVAGPRDKIEECFLNEQYARCLTNPRAHAALGCVSWLGIASGLMGFSFMRRPEAIRFYIENPLQEYLEHLTGQ